MLKYDDQIFTFTAISFLPNLQISFRATAITFRKFIKKNSSGIVDSMKIAKLLLEKNAMSSNCVLLVDKMYLQKSLQYDSSSFVGQDK